MKGHHDLIKLRLARQTPASLCIYDFPMDTDWAKWGEIPRITTHGDQVIDLDLRFVVGMTVMIESYNQDRAEHLFDKCVSAGAAIVAASNYPSPKDDPYNRVEANTRFYFRDKA